MSLSLKATLFEFTNENMIDVMNERYKTYAGEYQTPERVLFDFRNQLRVLQVDPVWDEELECFVDRNAKSE